MQSNLLEINYYGNQQYRNQRHLPGSSIQNWWCLWIKYFVLSKYRDGSPSSFSHSSASLPFSFLFPGQWDSTSFSPPHPSSYMKGHGKSSRMECIFLERLKSVTLNVRTQSTPTIRRILQHCSVRLTRSWMTRFSEWKCGCVLVTTKLLPAL